MEDEENPEVTLSFDLLFRGLEVTTGGQRIHDFRQQLAKMERMGMDPSFLKAIYGSIKRECRRTGAWDLAGAFYRPASGTGECAAGGPFSQRYTQSDALMLHSAGRSPGVCLKIHFCNQHAPLW